MAEPHVLLEWTYDRGYQVQRYRLVDGDPTARYGDRSRPRIEAFSTRDDQWVLLDGGYDLGAASAHALAQQVANAVALSARLQDAHASHESAAVEAILLIERRAAEAEADAKIGERHDAAAELWNLHRDLLADGPWPRYVRFDRLRREVCAAAEAWVTTAPAIIGSAEEKRFLAALQSLRSAEVEP